MCFLLILSHSKMIYNFQFIALDIFKTVYEKDHAIHVCGLRKKLQSNAFTQLPS